MEEQQSHLKSEEIKIERQPPKVNIEDLRIERIQAHHNVKNFHSYEKELTDFLIEDALDNQHKKISVTYLWFLKETNELVGYITLLNDRINLEGNLKEFFRDKGILYKSLPALKIGRLAVDDNFLRRGIGKLMIAFATKIAERISKRNRPPPVTDRRDARFARGGSFGVPEFSSETGGVRSFTPPVLNRWKILCILSPILAADSSL